MFLAISACLLASCEQIAYTCAPKTLNPHVIDFSLRPESWFTLNRDDPQSADGFSFNTKQCYVWRVATLDLGWWKAFAAHDPSHFVMEARGSEFRLSRAYRWDGMSLGETTLADLEASLLHDALYDAIQSGAPLKRRVADQIFLYMLRKNHADYASFTYRMVRAIGGIYNERYAQKSLLIVPTSPDVPASRLD